MSTAPAVSATYDRYHTHLWRLWQERERRRNAGREWSQIEPNWRDWHRIDARGRREFDRVEHREHHGPSFRPLWCAHCRAARRVKP